MPVFFEKVWIEGSGMTKALILDHGIGLMLAVILQVEVWCIIFIYLHVLGLWFCSSLILQPLLLEVHLDGNQARFGRPHLVASRPDLLLDGMVDNGKQFNSQLFREFCYSLGTKVIFASVYHPQSNRAVERANDIIFGSIKKCLSDQKKGKWADELPKVIWSHNTSESRTTKFTPFRLLYGAEAMTPEELKNRRLRVTTKSRPSPRMTKTSWS